MRRLNIIVLVLLAVLTGCSNKGSGEAPVQIQTEEKAVLIGPKYVMNNEEPEPIEATQETRLSAHNEDELSKLLNNIEGETDEE